MVGLLLVAGGWSWFSRVPESWAQGERLPSPQAGFPAPPVQLANLAGETVTLEQYRGSVVVLNLWASWCGPCRAEMPALQALFVRYEKQGLVILGVNSTHQDSAPAARAFAAEMGLTFPVLLDVEGDVSRRYLLRALPSTFVIDRQGVIRAVLVGGPLSAATLQSQIEPLLGGK